MPDHGEPDKLSLPRQWPRHAKSAVLSAVSLAASASVLSFEGRKRLPVVRARPVA